MKKVLVVILMIVLVFCMSTNALAAPGAFVSSPSGNPTPILISFDPDDEDCTAMLIITGYSAKNSLPELEKTLMEKAYADVSGTDDLTKLNSDFANLVKAENLDAKNLAVSDLFDIRVKGCETHDGHYGFELVLSAETLKHFVALLHMNKDGNWELVENAEVTHNGEHLRFWVNSFSPFAIVVDTNPESGDSAQTGDDNMIYVYSALMVVSAISLVVILFVKRRKQDA